MDTKIFDTATLLDIHHLLTAHEQTVAVAESVTAGHLQVAFSLAEKSMDFFQGGITAYNLGQKARHLHVDPIHAMTCNCVSEKVALEMSVAVCRLFSADWGIAITGYASPVPEQHISSLFAYYAISFQEQPASQGIINAVDTGNPVTVRYFYANALLSFFRDVLRQHYSPVNKTT